MKASVFVLAAVVLTAGTLDATAQQASGQPEPQSPASAGVQSALPSAPQMSEAPSLGSPGPPLQSFIPERPPPRVSVSVVPPQDSRFANRLRAGAEEQRVQRAPGSGISGLAETGRGSRVRTQPAFVLPGE